MVYLNNIPKPGDDPATQSQAQILENFAQLNTQIAINHTSLIAGAHNGKHTFVTMIAQAAPATAAGEGAAWALNTGGTREQLYWRRESNGTQVPISIIGAHGSITGGAPPVVEAGAFNIASATRAAAGQFTVNFTTNMINTTYTVLLTPNRTLAAFGMGMNVTSKAAGNFTCECRNLSSGALSDPTSFSVLVLGETVS